MVTHRLTAIEQFDNICIVDNGSVVEQGNFAQLQQGVYFKRLLNRI